MNYEMTAQVKCDEFSCSPHAKTKSSVIESVSYWAVVVRKCLTQFLHHDRWQRELNSRIIISSASTMGNCCFTALFLYLSFLRSLVFIIIMAVNIIEVTMWIGTRCAHLACEQWINSDTVRQIDSLQNKSNSRNAGVNVFVRSFYIVTYITFYRFYSCFIWTGFK